MAATQAKPVEPKPEIKAAVSIKPTASASHPSYTKMIVAAISSLKDRTGSSLPAIKKFISVKKFTGLKELPSGWEKKVTLQLGKLVKNGKVQKIKGSFKVSEAKLAKVPAGKPKQTAPRNKSQSVGVAHQAKNPSIKATNSNKVAALKNPATVSKAVKKNTSLDKSAVPTANNSPAPAAKPTAAAKPASPTKKHGSLKAAAKKATPLKKSPTKKAAPKKASKPAAKTVAALKKVDGKKN